MLSEKNIYILNLKTRPDRLLFTKIKMHRVGFDMDKVNVVSSVNGRKDIECIKLFKEIKKLPRKRGLHQPINSLGALGILKTYLNIFKDAIDKNLDYIAMIEDDNYFHSEMILKIRKSISLLYKNDIIWVGSNQCFYNKKQIIKIKNNMNYQLNNSAIAGAFFIIFSKRMYQYIYNYLSKNFSKNIYPIDVLLDLILKKTQMKAVVLYPRPIIPEVRDSDNMGPRDHLRFYHSRKMHGFNNYDCFDLYDIVMNNYKSFNFEMYKSFYDKLKYYSIRMNNPIIGTLSVINSRRILESNFKTFNIIICTSLLLNSAINSAINSIISQDYLYWRITLKDIKKSNLSTEIVSEYNMKISEKFNVDDDEYVIELKEKLSHNMLLSRINKNLDFEPKLNILLGLEYNNRVNMEV